MIKRKVGDLTVYTDSVSLGGFTVPSMAVSVVSTFLFRKTSGF